MKKALFFTLILITVTFYRLPQAFFQQDEWATFGLMVTFEQNPFAAISNLLPRTFFDHFVPTTFLIDYLQYKFFGLEFAYWAFFSLIIHFFNSFLVYYLVNLLSGKNNLALFAGLIFAVNSNSHQAVTWISTATSTQGATFLSLISLILFYFYLKGQEKKNTYLFLSLFSFLLSLTFKENSIFLFIFFPVFWFIFSQKKDFLSLKKIIMALFLSGFFYLLVRGVLIISLPPIEAVQTNEPIASSFFNYFLRVLIIPFRALSQSIFTGAFLLKTAEKFTLYLYPHEFLLPDKAVNPYVVESIGFDFISFIFAVFLFISFFFLKKYPLLLKEKKVLQAFDFSLGFIILGALPFIVIPGRAGYISLFEPRNLYLLGIGGSLFLAILLWGFSSFIANKSKFSSSVLLTITFLPLLLIHFQNTQKDIDRLMIDTRVRKTILGEIQKSYPHLPEKVIFYTESNSSYYGLPGEEKILPFQSGLGRTLLVWYQNHGEKFSACHFTGLWLFQIEDQGYKYCGGRGFGYFRKMEELKNALAENNLSWENVTAFSFSSEDESFTDISTRVRRELQGLP